MVVSSTPDKIPHDQRSIVSVGSFDGVHRAHQQILQALVKKAESIGGRSVVVTFDPHPQNVLRPDHPLGILTTIPERRALCESLGIDVFCVVPFSYEFSRTPWQEFVRKVIVDTIGVTEMIEGFNHHFGRDREGGIDALRTVGKELGFVVTAIDPVIVRDIEVSSTKIRHRLLKGDVETASELLGRPYAITGTVVHGDKRGAAMGYPTANIQPNDDTKLVPENGIYVVSVEGIEEGSRFGLASIGVRPTFHTDGPRTLEVFVLDHSEDLYDAELTIGFLHRLRGEEKFGSKEELIKQMDKDKADALSYLSAVGS